MHYMVVYAIFPSNIYTSNNADSMSKRLINKFIAC